MEKCRKCGIELNDKTWFKSIQEKNNCICKTCLITTSQKTINQRQREKRRINKIQVITYYSKGTMACANPYGEHKEPYTTIEALSIDHINGGGNKIREDKMEGSGSGFYRWLIRNNYPEGFQALCMNCQFIKKVRNKEHNGKKEFIYGH